MQHTYFYRLYHHSKSLFILIAGFSFFTVFFNLLGDEVTPFFVWGMFSEVKTPQASYEVYEIKLDGQHYDYTNLLTDPNRFYITGPLNLYRSMQAKGEAPTRAFFKEKLPEHYPWVAPFLEPITNTEEDLVAFPAWLKRYLEQSTQQRYQRLEVNILTVHYVDEGRVEILDSKPFIRYET